MFKPRYALIVMLGFLVGCTLSLTDFVQFMSIPGAGTPSVGDVAPDNISDPNAPALDSPAASQAPIKVRLSNPTQRDADCLVTMELIGREVHFSLRRILATTDSIVIGPDRADIVRIEATFLGEPPAAMDPQVLRIGQDFSPGDIIDFTLALPPDDSGQDVPDDDQHDDEAPPPPPTITIEGLDQDVIIDPGDSVTFDIVTTNASEDARVSAFADPDSILDNENEITILEDVLAADRTTVIWNTSEVSPGTYLILAQLRDGDDLIRAEPAPGYVIIVAPPPTGACCYADAYCEILTEDECVNGLWLGPDTTCDMCPECFVLCPAEARPEGEPCGESTNAGCFGNTFSFEPIACGETVCGTSWMDYDPNDPNEPNLIPADIDWYEIIVTEDTEITFTVEAEFGVFIAFAEQEVPGDPNCDNWTGGFMPSAMGEECDAVSISQCVGPGTYYAIVFPDIEYEMPCDGNNDYVATLTCQPCTIIRGACCFSDYFCLVLTEVECSLSEGDYQGDDTTCDPNPCIPPEGACCFWDGYCEVMSEENCSYEYGEYQGDYTTCDPNPCPQPPLGACCFEDYSCELMTGSDCNNADGQYQGDDTTCTPNPCSPPPILITGMSSS